MPRNRVGELASAASAVMTGASSPASCRSRSSPYSSPVPSTSRPSRSSVTSAPIWSRTSRRTSPACVVDCGQPGTRTRPPTAAAAARNGPAFDRSGSTWTSRALISPASTSQRPGVASSTTTPASRSTSTVIWMWGRLGMGGPSWTTSSPSRVRAPTSRSAETNWLEADASIRTVPPRSPSCGPCTVNGSRPRPPSSTCAPSWRTASTTAPMGRSRARSSPSNSTGEEARAATGGRKRITVPARPQSTRTPPVTGPGRTTQHCSPGRSPRCPPSATSETSAPRLRRASAMRVVSRETSGSRRTEGRSARAATTR